MAATGDTVDFEMTDTMGNTVALSSFRGKTVYIDAWATWCGPCLQEAAVLSQLWHQTDTAKVQIMSISVDKNKAAWLKMVAREGYPWPQFIAEGGTNSRFCRLFSIRAVPRFILIDPQGHVVTQQAPHPSEPRTASWLNQMAQ